MFSWVCSRCGHEVPPSKTECPFCTPPALEPVAAQGGFAPPPPPPPHYQPPQPTPQYAQQAPPQYWQPLGPPPPQYPQQGASPQQYPPQYPQQPPQYWQPQQYPPQQYPPQQYQPAQEQPPQQYQPPPPPPPPQEPPLPQYQAALPQYAPAPPQYTPPAPVAEYRQPEPIQNAPTPWLPPEEQEGKPVWLKAALAFVGVLAVLGLVYYLTSSHGSSAAKDAAKQQTTNPLQKYVEVVGIRIVGEKNGETVTFLVVNHGSAELTDVTANVTLWASTQRSEEDSVGTFTFHVDSLGPDGSKELSAPLKTEKGPADMPEDWRNVTADVQIASAQ
jgi:hypothetical protein